MKKGFFLLIFCLAVFVGCNIGFSNTDRPQPYTIVGSINSDVYHYSYCPLARSIFPDNLIIFQDEKTAQLMGRRLADPCLLYKLKRRR